MLTSLANWVQDQVAAHGLTAIFVLMVLESACIPIPSEVTMVYAGYLVSQGDLVFWQAVLVGDGAARSEVEALMAPLGGRVFFAGEHTDSRVGPGGMEGAIKSGYRVAREVLGQA